MQIDVGKIETVTRVDVALKGMTSTEISDLITLLSIGLDSAKSRMTNMSGSSKLARERLIASGTALAEHLDKIEDQMNNLPSAS